MDNPQDPPAFPDNYAADFEPLRGTWYSRIDPDGIVLEIDVRVVALADWPGRRESLDPKWRPVRFTDSGMLVAVKVQA